MLERAARDLRNRSVCGPLRKAVHALPSGAVHQPTQLAESDPAVPGGPRLRICMPARHEIAPSWHAGNTVDQNGAKTSERGCSA
jgi:hypothetical protein